MVVIKSEQRFAGQSRLLVTGFLPNGLPRKPQSWLVSLCGHNVPDVSPKTSIEAELFFLKDF
jgi:hypothetical protein